MKIRGLTVLFLMSLFSAPLYAGVDYFYLKKNDGDHYIRCHHAFSSQNHCL
ncbi:Uncharacterised protein [Serratia grimesii]|nr:Uncharacterised protein [Serratia grimesii]SMZ54718.1 Uncharacterised protein [Serratia grimesii]